MNKDVICNPYLPSYEYVPDGEPHVFGDRLYIFGSHDRFDGKEYCENDISEENIKKRLKKRVNYTTVDDLRLDYRIEGEGSYTIIFDGDMGATLEEWTTIVEELKKNLLNNEID